MSVFKMISASGSALTAERLRMDIIADNIANANTTRTENGGPYRRKIVSFEETLNKAEQGFGGGGVRVSAITEDDSTPVAVYDPAHPDADEKGFVLKPDIDISSEMVELISASRGYEANVTVLNATKQMALKTLSIGK